MKTKNRNRIVILGYGLRYPNGTGAGARIANYASGMAKLGISVTVLCLKPYETSTRDAINLFPHGTYQGAEYLYTCGTTIVAKKRWQRFLQNIYGLLGAIKFLQQSSKNEQFLAFLYYGIGHSNLYTLFGWIISRWYKAPFVGESTEAPFIGLADSILTRLQKFLFWQIIVKFPDGIITISQYLKSQFEITVRKDVPVKLVPIMVDIENFAKPTSIESKNITFCGSLYNSKEIETLLEIWSQVWPEFKDYKLRIIGGATSERIQYLESISQTLGIKDGVEFYGFVTRDTLPQILIDSAVLVLPRDAGLFSTAGLPNKLGEYLATGRPVLCTTVGDIPLYLEDNKSAFLVEPGESSIFAIRLKYILSNSDIAKQVGMCGQQVAKKEFNLNTNCLYLISFLQDIYNQNSMETR